jgi:peroxiredoxin
MLLLFVGIPVLLIIGLVAALNASQRSTSGGLVNASALNPGQQLLKVGTKAPNFTLTTLDGKRYQLSSLSGKPVLLEFFAVWCPHCQNEAPILNQIDKNYGAQGLQTLAILANPYGKNYDTSGGNDLRVVTKSDVTWFEQTFGVKHPTLIDPNFSTVNAYGVSSYPTIYVLDKHGVITYAQSGDQPYSALATAVAAAAK